MTPVAPDHENPDLSRKRYASIQFATDNNQNWTPQLWSYWYVILFDSHNWIFIRYEDGNPHLLNKQIYGTFQHACDSLWGNGSKYRVLSNSFLPVRIENVQLTNDEKEESIREFLELNRSDTPKDDRNVNESLLQRYPGTTLAGLQRILDRSLMARAV